MNKTLKLAILCITICTALFTAAIGSKISYAVDGELDIFSNSDNDVNDIEEEEEEEEEAKTEETKTTETKTEDIEEEEEQKPAQEPEKKQEESVITTTTTTTQTKVETVEETKLPQTGEKENFLMIVGAIMCTGLAVFAFKKAKKYNI